MTSGGFSGVIDFWFGSADSPVRGRARKEWFVKSDDFDRQICARFSRLWEDASRGALKSWESTPLAALALVIVLDQFPRNMFRGTARAFASDALALETARRSVDRGFDRVLRPVERVFVYLPFEHAETVEAQRRALALMSGIDAGIPGGTFADYARRHYEVVARFG